MRAAGVTAALALALLVWLTGCAAPEPPSYERRIAEARRRAEDAAIQARLAQVEAALERERAEVGFDELELRVRDLDDHDNDLRVLARIPVPDPKRLAAERAARRAETEGSVARLEETVLERSAEECLLAVATEEHEERDALYGSYAEQLRGLLTWNQEGRSSGAFNVRTATRFEIEARVKLATRMPDLPPVDPGAGAGLPSIERPGRGALDQSVAVLRDTIRREHPTVGVHAAASDRFRALSERAESRGRPWFEFVDLAYESRQHDDDALSGQVALRVPLGSAARHEAARFQALARGELREGDGVVLERARVGLGALRAIDRFETNTERWLELLALAEQAEAVAERWWRERLATPAQVATLFDQAYSARSSVLDARSRAGRAGCTLLAATGLEPRRWPRGSGSPD